MSAIGGKADMPFCAAMSANDPKRTSGGICVEGRLRAIAQSCFEGRNNSNAVCGGLWWQHCTSNTKSPISQRGRQHSTAFAARRTEAGVTAHRIYQPLDDPAYVVLQLDFPSVEQAQAFREFLEARVWSMPANSPGLVGSPQARVLL